MKLFCKVLLLAFLCPLLSFAQSNYKPGYVVTLKGDTLRGFINYVVWDSNPKEISFKTTAVDNETRKFTPADIGFFNIDGQESYQRYSGIISMDATDAGHISNGKDVSFKIDTVFLQLIQKGNNIAFYSYFDGFKTRFYIADKPDYLPVEMGYHLYTNSSDGSQAGKTVVDNAFMKQLFASAEKYGVLTTALQNDIQHLEYSKYDILDIVSKINGISKAEYKEKYSAKTSIRLFASAALSVTTIRPFGYYKKAGGKTETSYFPAVSFGLDLFANPHTEKLTFRVEGMISENQYKSIYIYTGSPYVPVRYSYTQLCLALAPQVIYNFYTKNDFAIFAGVGVAATFYKYSNATYDLNYADTKVTNGRLNPAGFFSAFNVPVLFKAGIKLNKNMGLFVNYFTSTQATQDIHFNLNASTIQAGLIYAFN